MNKGLWRKFVAEFLGTSALVFFGCGAIAVSATFELPELLWFVPLIFGATIAFMIYSVGHLSGGHFNPAVTIAFALVKRLSPQAVLPYVLAQLSGALFGCLLILLLVPGAETYGATQPAIDWLPALGVEIILTFFLMLVIISVATDKRAPSAMAGMAIGMTVMVGSFFGGPLSGAAMNPARSLAPALFEGRMDFLWLYLLGPILGAGMAALLYQWMRGVDQDVV